MAEAQVCSKCSHVNPREAVYCYHDGMLLAGHGRNGGGPVNAGTMPFPTPFVFPTGQSCQNFDQLAMACQQNWQTAVDLLRQGFLVGFFGGLGRADLALAAQEAARHPDPSRGLDHLLTKLPTNVLEAPKLRVEPREVNLGIVPMGSDRSFELHLSNQGMRLLHGTVASDSKWLTIGEAPGQDQKLIQFTDDAALPIQIRGAQLRAGPKPLVGQLLIQYNGEQQAAVKVRLEVPVKPFPHGVLAGANSPRQVAEKAKAAPKEAAALFENGAVAKWFGENGWIYPVQGPSASGLGAVQQFFEALGLAKAPKVVIDKQSLSLQGNPGESLSAAIEVKTPEKRPVYAHATADEGWLDVSRTELSGRVATITVAVPRVPDRPGETLTAKVRVAANGNQRFEVPCTLQVRGTRRPRRVTPVPAAPVGGEADLQFEDDVPAAAPTAAVAAAAGRDDADPFGAFAIAAAPVGESPAAPAGARPGPGRGRRRAPATPWYLHAIPAGILMLVLLVTVVADWFFGGPSRLMYGGFEVHPYPRILIYYDYNKFYKGEAANTLGATMKFGVISEPEPGAPPTLEPGRHKKLTFREHGFTNNTVLRVDPAEGAQGKDTGRTDFLFGSETHGSWAADSPRRTPNPFIPALKDSEATYITRDTNLEVTQTVKYMPGEPLILGAEYKRYIDTCLVLYAIRNTDSRPHRVGLRFLLDTLIGDNDGAPFALPGSDQLVDTLQAFDSAPAGEKEGGKKVLPVPDFIMALERADLKDPGTIAQLNLNLGGKLEPPARVLLTQWPGWAGNNALDRDRLESWDIPLEDIHKNRQDGDSAVALYWPVKELQPGETRVLGFSYGLGVLGSGGKLGLTVGGNFTAGGELTVVGLVNEPEAGAKLRLILPEGMSILGGTPAVQDVPAPEQAGRPSPVTWRVRPNQAGTFVIQAQLEGTDVIQERPVVINSSSIFD